MARFRALLSPEGQALLSSLPDYDDRAALALGARLREHWPPELVASALTQSRLRARARAKFGTDATRMYFTGAGLEQATRPGVAVRRAARYRDAGLHRVADLCCGIGGDLVPLARAGLDVLAVDRDPLAVEVARANAEAFAVAERVELRCADVTEVDLVGCDAAFVDPARRDERGRRLDPEAWSPEYSWVRALADRFRATGAKVAPGIAHALVPPGVEAEWVSVGGDVVEAALWWGELSSGAARRATLLPSDVTLTDADLPAGEVAVAPPRRYLYEPDGAVIRAGLVAAVAARLDGALLDPSIAYVTADRLTSTAYAAAYEITDVLPFSVKRLRAVLRARGVGVVTIKKRGSAVDPEQLRRQLPLEGSASAVVVLTRVGGAPTALLAQPA